MRLRTICAVVTMVIVAGSFSVLRAEGSEGSKKVGLLLSEARRAATQAWGAAAEMQQYRLSRVGWETHTAKLTEIKALVNTVGQRVAQLNQRWGEASNEQKAEIERLTHALVPLVASYETTFSHLQENQQNIDNCVRRDPHYQALLNANSELAERLTAR